MDSCTEEVKISVVMAVYNGEKYLREAVDSILAQTLKGFEFIIIDDGSSDESANIISEYCDSRIRFVQQKNSGLAAALNKGIQLARGKYIARMDQDDISVRNRFEEQFSYMETHHDVGILGGQVHFIDGKGTVIGEKLVPVEAKLVSWCMPHMCPVIHPTYLVRRTVYESLGGYRSISVEDYDFLVRANMKGVKIKNLPCYLLYYRLNYSGMTRTNPLRTLLLTARVRAQLSSGVLADDKLRQISNYEYHSGKWLQLLYNFRTDLLFRRKTSHRMNWLILTITAHFISLFHYQLLIESYHSFVGMFLMRVSFFRMAMGFSRAVSEK